MKRNIRYYVNNLMLFERNREWLISNIKLKYKVSYYFQIVKSYLGVIMFKNYSIKYLGKNFTYDNPATPLNLQNYPYEITNKILANMNKRPKTALDIGGNIGQFSITLKHMLGEKAKIDIFEPNKVIFPLLLQNIKGLKNIKAYNYAIGERNAKVKMYVETGRSGTASFIEENASDNKDLLNTIDIDMINSIPSYTRRKHYDIVKIDVEGYEYNVIKTLKNITMNYLFIEVSSGRSKNYLHSELFAMIAKKFGAYDIVYSSTVSKYSNTYDILLEFENKVK